MKFVRNFKTFVNERMQIAEGAMSELDLMAKEAKSFKAFTKEVFKEFKNLPKKADTLKWLEELYNDAINEAEKAEWFKNHSDDLKGIPLSIMCEEETGVIRKAMSNAGTPCPYKSLIGDAAQIAYELDNKVAEEESNGTLKRLFNSENDTKIGIGTVFGSLLFLFLL